MSGITSAGSNAISRVPVVAAASLTGGTAAGSIPSANLPVVGELPFTGAPLALVVAIGICLIGSGLTIRTVAYIATKRSERKLAQRAG